MTAFYFSLMGYSRHQSIQWTPKIAKKLSLWLPQVMHLQPSAPGGSRQGDQRKSVKECKASVRTQLILFLVRGQCGINKQSFSVTRLYPSIHPSISSPSSVGEGAGVRPSCLIVGVGCTLDKMPVRDWANTERQTAIHAHTDAANLPLARVFELREGAALPGEKPTCAHAHTDTHGWPIHQKSLDRK